MVNFSLAHLSISFFFFIRTSEAFDLFSSSLKPKRQLHGDEIGGSLSTKFKEINLESKSKDSDKEKFSDTVITITSTTDSNNSYLDRIEGSDILDIAKEINIIKTDLESKSFKSIHDYPSHHFTIQAIIKLTFKKNEVMNDQEFIKFIDSIRSFIEIIKKERSL